MELGNALFGHSRGKYELPRGKHQELFLKFFDEVGFDNYGFIDNPRLKPYETETGGFSNNIFEINPYCWDEDVDRILKPNFVYKPEGIEIRWYKYPLRDAYSNTQLAYDKLKEILEICKNSVFMRA